MGLPDRLGESRTVEILREARLTLATALVFGALAIYTFPLIQFTKGSGFLRTVSGVVAASTVDTLFFDDFETGDYAAAQNNIAWVSIANQESGVSLDSASKMSGVHSMRFEWPSPHSGGDRNSSEANISFDNTSTNDLTAGLDTFAIKYETRIENWSQRTGIDETRKLGLIYADEVVNDGSGDFFLSLEGSAGDSAKAPYESMLNSQIFISQVPGFYTFMDYEDGFNPNGNSGCPQETALTCRFGDRQIFDNTSPQTYTVCQIVRIDTVAADSVTAITVIFDGDTILHSDTLPNNFLMANAYHWGFFNGTWAADATDTVRTYIDNYGVYNLKGTNDIPAGCT